MNDKEMPMPPARGLWSVDAARDDDVLRHLWMLDLFHDLYRYAYREGLTGLGDAIISTSEVLLDELRSRVGPANPASGAAGA